MKDNEIFENDDMESKPKITGPKIPDIGDIPLKTDVLREQQKKDVIQSDEVYETELGINEKNTPVTREKFDNIVKPEDIPILESPQGVIDEAKKKKYTFQQDENNPIPTKKTSAPPSKIVDISEETEDESREEPQKEADNSAKSFFSRQQSKKIDPDELDEDADSKEYISRHETIYSEKKEIEKFVPKKETVEYEEIIIEEDDDEDKKGNVLLTIFFILLAVSILLGGAVLVSQWIENPPIKIYDFSDEEMDILTEEYEFISETSRYLKKVNKIVDEEKEIIDKYVSKQLTKEEVVEKLNDTLRRKKEIKEDYIKLKPKEQEVITTKSLSDDIINNTISYTESAINSIDIYTDAKIVGNFNLHVEENNSNIYMYNQYVISVFKSRNITITYDGINFAMDTKWLEKNKDK